MGRNLWAQAADAAEASPLDMGCLAEAPVWFSDVIGVPMWWILAHGIFLGFGIPRGAELDRGSWVARGPYRRSLLTRFRPAGVKRGSESSYYIYKKGLFHPPLPTAINLGDYWTLRY